MVGTAGLDFPSLTRWMPHIGPFASRNVIHPRPPGPKPGALKTELRSDEMDSERLNRNAGVEKRAAANLGQRQRGEI